MTTMLSSKEPGEGVVVSFLFANELLAGETIASCATVATLAEGVDLSPQNVVSGVCDLSTPTKALQKVIGGVDGCTYLLKATATLSSGRVLIRKGILPVSTD